jgi:hypothetical protein
MTILTIPTIPPVSQTTSLILTQSPRILTDGRPQHSQKDTSQTQHYKGWKDLYDSQDYVAKHNHPSMKTQILKYEAVIPGFYAKTKTHRMHDLGSIEGPCRSWSWPTHDLIKSTLTNQPNQTNPTKPGVSTNHLRVHAAHDREHGCYNSFTLCRGCTRYPWVVIILR